MTAEIDIPLEGVILVVLGTVIMLEDMAMAQINLLEQTVRMVGMGAVMAPAMVSVAVATIVMDSPILITRQGLLQDRITSNPSSLLRLRTVHRPLQLTNSSPSLRHKLLSNTLHPWFLTPCLLSSLSKHLQLDEVIYCFLSCFKFYII